MSEATRVLKELPGPCWIFAAHQTGARGRRGRAWAMPAGNFSASLVLPNAGSPAEMGLRSFVASLALFDAVRAVAGPNANLSLKWPNDVLLNGGKLAGILLESAGNALVIGVGVNLAKAPDVNEVEEGALRPVALKFEAGADVMHGWPRLPNLATRSAPAQCAKRCMVRLRRWTSRGIWY